MTMLTARPLKSPVSGTEACLGVECEQAFFQHPPLHRPPYTLLGPARDRKNDEGDDVKDEGFARLKKSGDTKVFVDPSCSSIELV